ncbi:MAG: starch-binding protein, partial [Lachnospiraceae bacterium]|nr:starch-binding protein [Lachnospiraceae bacterium]
MTYKKIISIIMSLVLALSIIAIPASADEIKTITVHYFNENNWSQPYIYYYYGSNTGDSWPGNAMSSEGDGWYTYKIYNYSTAYVIFSDNGANQNPVQNEQGFQVTNEMWYYKGDWSTEKPESIFTIVHYYNENNWSAPYIYYYSDNNNPITWPGRAMISEGGNWYTYTIPDIANPKVVFSDNGTNQNPDQNSPGFNVTGEKWYLNGTFYDSEPEGITVHYQNYDNWDHVNIYYYNGEKTGSDWTGVPMIADGDGWFTYKIYGFDSVKVLFNNGGNIQIPGKFEPGFDVSGEMWYRNGEWTTDRPDEIIVYFYKPGNWDTPNIYYYKNDNDTGPAWPGEQMESEGNNWYKFTITKYNSAKVIFNGGNSQIPAQNQPGFDVTGIMLYKNGVWYDSETDTDGDGLEDYMELLLGTDLNKTDTDGDGLNDGDEVKLYGTDPLIVDTDGDRLPDGYEVLTLHTNPNSLDSNDDGITDDIEDFDSDNLTNYEEYILGTDPYNADTDGDYLSDGEEVNVYHTDPLNPDTDGDGIMDGDEIILDLNPNISTDGQSIVEQTIPEEELRVNNYNNDFKISIEVSASNNVKRFLKQGVSKYAGILSDNRAIVGVPVNIEYSAGSIESGSITFKLDSDYVSGNPHYYPELNLGIERYCVFYYDKSVGTIIPLDCSYESENNTITVDAKYMGDLMVVDYEALMYDLGIQIEDLTTNSEIAPYTLCEDYVESETLDTAESDNFSGNEDTDYEDMSLEEIESIISGRNDDVLSYAALSSVNVYSNSVRQVDLVLVVDTTGSMGSSIAAVKTNIASLINRLRDEGISLYVSIVDYRDITCDGIYSTKVNNNSGIDFYNSISDISAAISSLYASGGGDGPETPIDGLGKAYNLRYRSSAAKFAFLITDAPYKVNNNFGISSMNEIANMLNSKDILTSVVTYSSNYSAYSDLTDITGGSLILMNENFCDAMYQVIFSQTPKSSVVIANNLVTGYFKEPLVYGGLCNSDGDSLTDSDEIDWKNVKLNSDGSYSLYTWKELCEKSGIWHSIYDDGKSNPLFEYLSDIYVIPALSNPFSADTDNDYYPDGDDDDNLTVNAMYIYDSAIDDSDFHNGSSIVEKTPDKYTDGTLSLYTDIGENEYSAKYSFSRRSGEYSTFSLTPDRTSFYKFTNEASMSAYVFVSYEKKTLWWSETISVEQEEDGTYLLNGGTEYTIETYGVQSGGYNFTVEQDNWVYAPNGCIQTVAKYSRAGNFTSTPFESSYYISQGLLYAIIADLVGTKQDLSDIDNVEKIMEDLGYDSTEYQVTDKDIGSVVVADVLLIFAVYSLGAMVAESGFVALYGTSSQLAGTVSTVGTVIYDVLFTPHLN